MKMVDIEKAKEEIAAAKQEVDGKDKAHQNMQELFDALGETNSDATAEDVNLQDNAVPKSSEEARKQNLAKLCKDGCKTVDESSIVVATDKYKEFEIIVSSIISEVENQRTYAITECNREGIVFGKENIKAEFTAYEVEQGATKIERLIRGFQGNYSGQISDILMRIQKVEIDRVLIAKPIKNVGAMLFEDIMLKLGKFIKNNLTDNRIGCCVIDGICHVGIVKRGEKTTDAIFREIIHEIAPYNNYAAFKRELCDRELIYHDMNERSRDMQKSISKDLQKKIGATGEKIISFKLSQEELGQIAEAYRKIANKRGLVELEADLTEYIQGLLTDETGIIIEGYWSDIFPEEDWDEFYCVEDE